MPFRSIPIKDQAKVLAGLEISYQEFLENFNVDAKQRCDLGWAAKISRTRLDIRAEAQKASPCRYQRPRRSCHLAFDETLAFLQRRKLYYPDQSQARRLNADSYIATRCGDGPGRAGGMDSWPLAYTQLGVS